MVVEEALLRRVGYMLGAAAVDFRWLPVSLKNQDPGLADPNWPAPVRGRGLPIEVLEVVRRQELGNAEDERLVVREHYADWGCQWLVHYEVTANGP